MYLAGHFYYFNIIYLVEDGFLRTDEAPAEGLVAAVWVSDGQANVEELAVVFDIRVVSVVAAVATEGVADVSSNAGGVAGEGQ